MESEEQYIRIKAILEVVGKPADYIENTLKEYVDKIKLDESLMLVNERISPAKEQEEYFSTFAEIEVVIKGMVNLVGFCIDYMPASIEILKPEEFHFEQRDFTNFTNDLLAKLHKVDMIAKRVGMENTLLKNNMNRVIQNSILLLLKFGINKEDDIKKAVGIVEVMPYLDFLVKENRIKEVNGKYSLG